jgi:hypothetical protein
MHDPVPQSGEDRWAPLIAGLVFVAGVALLVYALTASGGRGSRVSAADAVTPAGGQPALTVVGGPQPAVEEPAQQAPAPRPRRATWDQWTHMFRPLYRSGDRAFGVSWLLLAAVHKQETGFSTAEGTYRGLNFAGCCAGPMQFNVTNGRTSTWDRFAHAFRAAPRPASYPHVAISHPSVYDDFDAMMAAARLLSHSGATRALDGRAWQAAFDYYGHDAFGVSYADVVVARARNWASNGFAALSEPSPQAVASVHADYGAAALNALAPPPTAKKHHKPAVRAFAASRATQAPQQPAAERPR